MLTRRQLLQRSAILSLAPNVPAFLKSLQAEQSIDAGRILIVIQLSGGNDGLNTLVPYQDEVYLAARKTLRIPEERLIKIRDSLGLHPQMKPFAELVDDGQASIIQGVGYSDSSRSHDVSTAVWQSGRTDAERHRESGWIGRLMDSKQNIVSNISTPQAVSTMSEGIPLALRCRKSRSASLRSVADLQTGDLPKPRVFNESQTGNITLEQFMRRAQLEAFATAEQLREISRSVQSKLNSQLASLNNPLASQLNIILKLIQADYGPQIYYAEHTGFDTHYDQLAVHGNLLGQFSSSIYALMRDLQSTGLQERVMVMCFSEFGRQVIENASGGTDHGTVGPVFLAGHGITPGIHGQSPNLQNLCDNAPSHTIDFRDIYSGVLKTWLEIDPRTILDGHQGYYAI